MSLADDIIRAVEEDGLCELTIRVSRYSDISRAMKEPEAWQAIAKYQDAEKGPWGVGIRAHPVKAVEAALKHRVQRPHERPEDIFS